MTHSILFAAALGGSALVHLLLAGVSQPPQPPTLSGGDVAGEVALGQGFADMVSGVMTPREGEARALSPVEAPEITRAPVSGPTPTPTPTPTLASPTRVAPTPLSPVSASSGDPVLAAVTPTAPAPSTLGPAPSRPPIKAPSSSKAETIAAKPAPRADTPPKARPREIMARARPPKEPPAPLRGNAGTTQAKGKQTGKAGATKAETTNAKASTSEQVGGKELKRYQALVMRRIQRTAQRSSGSQGTTIVGIAISGNGQIASLKILRSSGAPRTDQAALDHIRRAAPFGATPTQARLDVAVAVESKG